MAMRPKKQPTVRLVVEKHNMSQEFSISHAERLLDMGVYLSGGWTLPEDSNYIYDEENGLRLKSNKGNTAEAK